MPTKMHGFSETLGCIGLEIVSPRSRAKDIQNETYCICACKDLMEQKERERLSWMDTAFEVGVSQQTIL